MAESSTRPLKVIQWATGGVGRAAIEGILRHPDLELVGCWVSSDAKNGKDVGEIIGAEPVGITATADAQTLLALDADCVMYSPLFPDPAVVESILKSGKNIVTPVGWVYPDRTDPRVMALIEAGQSAGVTLHGSGIHPGGVTERFPLMVSALSSAITRVRGEEFSDIRTYNSPDVVRHIMGFGATPQEATTGPMAGLLEGGFKMSIRMVADELGFDIEPDIRTTQEVAVAVERIETEVLTIEPGTVAARRFRWDALVDGEPVVTAAVNWLWGEAQLDPPWQLGDQGERFEVEVSGDPDVQVVLHGVHPESVQQGLERNPGIVATAMHCVNAIPYVVAAQPGIQTYLDLPLLAGRAAPHLSKANR